MILEQFFVTGTIAPPSVARGGIDFLWAFISGNKPTPPAPTAMFVGVPLSGQVPLTVHFTDLSTGGPTSWLWDFGDGATSTVRNPTHVYVADGSYTVSLLVANTSGSDLLVKPNYITALPVPPAPVADFVGVPLSGAAPLSVSFTDLSTNAPTSWLWDFGDGSGSTQQNPAHTYATAGSWTVTLTASNAGGSSTLSKPAYVTTTAPVPPAPPSGNFSGAGGGVWVKTKTSRMERDEFPRVPVPDDGEDVAVPLALVLLLAEA